MITNLHDIKEITKLRALEEWEKAGIWFTWDQGGNTYNMWRIRFYNNKLEFKSRRDDDISWQPLAEPDDRFIIARWEEANKKFNPDWVDQIEVQ